MSLQNWKVNTSWTISLKPAPASSSSIPVVLQPSWGFAELFLWCCVGCGVLDHFEANHRSSHGQLAGRESWWRLKECPVFCIWSGLWPGNRWTRILGGWWSHGVRELDWLFTGEYCNPIWETNNHKGMSWSSALLTWILCRMGRCGSSVPQEEERQVKWARMKWW